MLKLSETTWVDLLPGVRVEVRPVSPLAMRRARKASRLIFEEGGEDLEERAGDALSLSLAIDGVVSWEGVGDLNGVPVAPSPETVTLLMRDWRAAEAFDARYVLPALSREAEKNGSPPSPNGSSAGAGNTARPAANPVPTARPSNTSRKRTKDGKPGTSSGGAAHKSG